MIVSTKGRYALRVMIDLAENSDGSPLAMKDIAQRQDISLKYLEQILPRLVKNGLLEGRHGKGGGYKLTRLPSEYTIREIILAAEGDLAAVSCLEKDAKPCDRASFCRTLPMWVELNDIINDFFENKTLADLVKK